MRWAQPEWLWGLLVLPALVGAGAARARWRRRALLRFGDPATLARLSSAPSAERRALALGLGILAFGSLVLALGRPQWGARMEEIRRRGIDLVLAVDLSRSMLTPDIRPSRLQVARQAIAGLLDRLPGERVGLVGFAGSAHVFCPLTLDHAAARMFLDVLEPSLVPDPGSALGAAIRKGVALFDPKQRKYKVMILFTDGEDHATAPLEAAREAAEAGVLLFAVGVGTQAGEPIPLRDEAGTVVDYVRDRSGAVVTSRLNADLLDEISRTGGGAYFTATPGQEELDRIADAIAGLDRKDLSSRLAANREERFQVPLAAALVLLAAQSLVWIRRRRVPFEEVS